MQHRHYFQSDINIESETDDVKFKRYIENDNKRFLQYVEGTLEEILPEDFDEGVTTIPEYSLFLLTDKISLKRIVFPDSVTTIGTKNDDYQLLNFGTDLEIVFPANLKVINGSVLFSNLYNTSVVCDFSKAKQVPTINTQNSGAGFYNASVIYIPASLYNQWTTTEKWKDVGIEKFVSV